MIDMAGLVSEDHTLLGLRGDNKRQVLQRLAEVAATATGLDAERLLEALLQREDLGTTGLGDGVAIPHARVAELAALTGFFARLAEPVDFEALDGEAVDLIFLLLAPASAGADHLKALARIARLMRDSELCEALRTAATAQATHDLLTGGGTTPPRDTSPP